MKIGCFGDLHFGKQMDAQAGLDRDAETMTQVLAAIDVFRDRGVDVIACLGDVSNSNHPSIAVNTRIRGLLEILAAEKGGAVVIPGNHDYTYAGRHVLEPLGLYTDQTILLTEGVAVVPWRPGDMAAALQETDAEIILTHALFNGGSVPSGFTIRSAIDPPSGRFIVAGDVHGSQRFRTNRSWVAYPGSLTQTDFGERGQDKGVFILDTDDPITKSEWVQVPGYMEYLSYTVAGVEDFDEIDWAKSILDVVVTDPTQLQPVDDYLHDHGAYMRRLAVQEQVVEDKALINTRGMTYYQQFDAYEDWPTKDQAAGHAIIDAELKV